MKHICCFSGGKDSTAMLIYIYIYMIYHVMKYYMLIVESGCGKMQTHT